MINYLIALSLPSKIQTELSRLCFGLPTVQWLETDSLHLTLRYLGPLSDQVLADVKEKLNDLYFNPFMVQLAGVEHLNQTVYVSPQAQVELDQLKKSLDLLLRGFSLPPYRLKPHVLLGSSSEPIQQAKLFDYLASNSYFLSSQTEINRCSLFSVNKSPKKVFYQEVAAYSAKD